MWRQQLPQPAVDVSQVEQQHDSVVGVAIELALNQLAAQRLEAGDRVRRQLLRRHAGAERLELRRARPQVVDAASDGRDAVGEQRQQLRHVVEFRMRTAPRDRRAHGVCRCRGRRVRGEEAAELGDRERGL